MPIFEHLFFCVKKGSSESESVNWWSLKDGGWLIFLWIGDQITLGAHHQLTNDKYRDGWKPIMISASEPKKNTSKSLGKSLVQTPTTKTRETKRRDSRATLINCQANAKCKMLNTSIQKMQNKICIKHKKHASYQWFSCLPPRGPLTPLKYYLKLENSKAP